VAVERPTYDLTISKLHCGRLTLKIYTKGERVLRIEAMAHDTAELHCGRGLERFPRIVTELRDILERFTQALSCIDQCFISDEALEQLPAASHVGKTKVGGIDFNKPRMRHFTAAVVALSTSPRGIGNTRHYEPAAAGLRALAALLVLRDTIIKPLLAASMETRPTRESQNPRALDDYYATIRVGMQGVFRELGLVA
jgi:hypothetical protein